MIRQIGMALLAALAALTAIPANAQFKPEDRNERDLCTDRPGLGTPACTVEPGRVVVELGLADWTLEKRTAQREDTFLFADVLARIGLSDATELQLGFTTLGHQRTRDVSGIDRATRVGDATVGIKWNLSNPDGSDFSLAVLPYVTLPTGRQPIGAGDWSAGAILPISFELSKSVQLQGAPEIAAAVDEDGHGRHPAFGGTVGFGVKLSDAVTTALEYQVVFDDDPSGRTTRSLAGFSIAWQPTKNFQIDTGSNLGLNRDSPDVELYTGITKRF